MYFTIDSNQDGEISVHMYTESELQEILDEIVEGDWGEVRFIEDLSNEDYDPNYWKGKGTIMLIIKGDIVTPKPTKIIERYIVS